MSLSFPFVSHIFHGAEVTDRRGGRGTDYRVDDSDVDGGGGQPVGCNGRSNSEGCRVIQ